MPVKRKPEDPTEPIRVKASRYPEVDEGTACTQSSFKTGKKAFLFVGMQGGRYKTMFKLQQSIPQATKLADEHPDDFQVGVNGWVTARFSADKPMPKKLWEKWLDESYELSRGNQTKTTARKSAKKKTIKKKKTAAKKKSLPKKKARKKTKKKST